MAYAFAMSYMNQYPGEKVGPSTFACDETLRNAKYASSLQALAVPVSDEEQTIFKLLNAQNFTLRLDLINTAASCRRLTIYEVSDSSTTFLPFLSCSDENGTLSATIFLPEHDLTIKANVDDIQLIGGLRVGLSGSGEEQNLYTLKELNFIQAFYILSTRTLAQTVTVNAALTKVRHY